MAPLNPNNTYRWFVDYTVAGFQHTLQMRSDSDVVASDAGATLAALFAAFDSAIYVATIDGFRSAPSGSNITSPEVWPGDASYGVGAGVPANSAQFYDMVGRGPTGHRVRIALFGAILVTDGGDYRMSSSEDALVANALAVLTSDAAMFLDIDYGTPVWKPYINLGVNAYWRNKIR